MADVAGDVGQQRPQAPLDDRAVEGRVAHAGADRKLIPIEDKTIQPFDAVDIDEMGRARQAKGHGRHQALAPGEHAAVVGRYFGEEGHGFVDRFRRVIAERGRLHRRLSPLPMLTDMIMTPANLGRKLFIIQYFSQY